MSIDELPDSLLIHILSFLNVNEAAITSVLSKRWQFLWMESPSLVFRPQLSRDFDNLRNFVYWANRTIGIRRLDYLEEFSVKLSFKYSCFSSDVDAWVEYAMKSKVKKLCLLLDGNGNLYTLPQVMYSSPFLTNLHLQGCFIYNLTSIQWPSLTHLHFHQTCFHDQLSLDQILSTCPLLCNLCLQDCYGFGHLEVNSPSLHTLSILESEYTSQKIILKISAPLLHTLYLYVSRDLHLRDFSSLVRADIEFEMMSNAKKLLRSVSHVKELYLGFLFFEVVSMMTLSGWQLPQSRRKLLAITSTSQHEDSISGIIGLLESSPNLETLVIEGCATKLNFHLLEHIVELAAKDDLVGDLLYLKTIKFRYYAYLKGKQILKLARILLKRATALEEMMIMTDVKDSSDFEEMSQTILTFPRSSTKAVVHIVK